MITQEYLKEHLEYNSETGAFIWIKKTHKSKANRIKVGATAGYRNSEGYIYIKINKVDYPAHRLAWLYMYGEYQEVLDHINHIRDDNRIENIRVATKAINSKNRTIPVNNTSGQMGVKWNKKLKKWQGQINIDGKRIYLGLFTQFHEAVDARKNAEVLYGFHKNHGSKK